MTIKAQYELVWLIEPSGAVKSDFVLCGYDYEDDSKEKIADPARLSLDELFDTNGGVSQTNGKDKISQ